MFSKASTNPQVTINNLQVAVVPNSVKYTEGFDEQNNKTSSASAVVPNSAKYTEGFYATSTGVIVTHGQYSNMIDVSTTVKEFFVNNLKQCEIKLQSATIEAGLVNENSLRATLIEFYNILSSPDFDLTETGDVARQLFIDNLIVSINLSDDSATITMTIPLVTQLRGVTTTMTIVFHPIVNNDLILGETQ